MDDMSNIEHERNWRATAEAHQMQRDEALAEAERLRAEWRKADDGWIACAEQLRGAVEDVADLVNALADAASRFRRDGDEFGAEQAEAILKRFGGPQT